MPIELAIGGGELTWRAGPLRKGPELRHGTAGNGFAFLEAARRDRRSRVAGTRPPVRDARDRAG